MPRAEVEARAAALGLRVTRLPSAYLLRDGQGRWIDVRGPSAAHAFLDAYEALRDYPRRLPRYRSCAR